MNGQLNVTPITDKAPQPSCKFSIQAALDGFLVTIEGEGRAGDLRLIIDRLKAIGAAPPVAQVEPATSEPTKKTAPICPSHGTQMKASRKPGAFFCPRRTDSGDFCPEKA